MNASLTDKFMILALHPEKGRISISRLHFRYSLTGSLFMQYLEQGEIAIENKRIIPLFRESGDALHNIIAGRITTSSGNKRITFWIKRFQLKSRLIFREMINLLEKKEILRREQKKLLNIIPYNRYWLIDKSLRIKLIEELRGALLYGKQPGLKEIMLLTLVETARAYKILSRERGEARLLRKKNIELLKVDISSPEIRQSVREIQTAVTKSIRDAIVASHTAS